MLLQVRSVSAAGMLSMYARDKRTAGFRQQQNLADMRVVAAGEIELHSGGNRTLLGVSRSAFPIFQMLPLVTTVRPSE